MDKRPELDASDSEHTVRGWRERQPDRQLMADIGPDDPFLDNGGCGREVVDARMAPAGWRAGRQATGRFRQRRLPTEEDVTWAVSTQGQHADGHVHPLRVAAANCTRRGGVPGQHHRQGMKTSTDQTHADASVQRRRRYLRSGAGVRAALYATEERTT